MEEQQKNAVQKRNVEMEIEITYSQSKTGRERETAVEYTEVGG